jgi:hypothetical protein
MATKLPSQPVGSNLFLSMSSRLGCGGAISILVRRTPLEQVIHTLNAHTRRTAEFDSFSWPHGSPEFIQGNTRLIASFQDTSVLCSHGLAVQAVSTPGFLGIVELDSAILEISRDRAVSADISSVLNAARIAITERMIFNLNAISSSGFLINKAPLINRCVSSYGRNVLFGSTLPWVSQMRIPGNLELVDSQTLISRLTNGRSVFLALNSEPWTAMKSWEASDPLPAEMALLMDIRELSPGPGFVHPATPKLGTLAGLFPDWAKVALLNTLIDLLAQAWQMTPSDLTQQGGWNHATTALWGRFRRG